MATEMAAKNKEIERELAAAKKESAYRVWMAGKEREYCENSLWNYVPVANVIHRRGFKEKELSDLKKAAASELKA